MDKLKIAFIGTGGMGQCAHLKNYAQLNNECSIIALAELREEVGKKVAARYSIDKVYKDASALLDNEKPDALIVSQPFTRHGILLPEVCRADIPVFIEKPLASSIAAGEAIIHMLAETKTPLMVGYHKRSDLATAAALKQIQSWNNSDEMGPMKYIRILMPAGDWIAGGFEDLIHGAYNGPDLEKDPPADDMDDETNDAYISFVNYYIHQVNLMRYLLDEPYTVNYADPSGVLLAGSSSSGIACTIEMTPYRTTIDWQEEILICFEYGYIKLTLPAPLAANRCGTVEIFSDPDNAPVPQVQIPQLPWEHAMKTQARNFIAFARGDAPAPCEADEAFEDLKVAREYIRLLKA